MISDLILIDGSQGEGGGQILRSSLALSMLTGKAFRIENIRANRPKTGLARQHLTAVQSAATICGAEVDGAEIGSRALTFRPGPVAAGEYTFSVGSAGSTTLVLQTVLPPLLVASSPSRLTLEGGTHNIHAPPLDFLEKAFLPLVERMGPSVSVKLERAGFYPAGGGRFVATIEPVPRLSPLHLTDRGEITHKLCKAVVAGLPMQIAERELAVVKRAMGWDGAQSLQVHRLPDDQGPGNIVTIEIGSEHVTEVFTGFGQRGVRAEAVAEDAVQQARKYLAANVPVGEGLADQLILPLAMAGGGSFLTPPPTRHTLTNIDVVRRFLDIPITAEPVGPDQWTVRLGSGR